MAATVGLAAGGIGGTGLWWLRSPGLDQDDAADVGSGGDVDAYGDDVGIDYSAVRPALWIDLNS